MDFNFEQLVQEAQAWQNRRDELFSKDFRKALSGLMYSCSGLERVAQKRYAECLFKKHDSTRGIPPTFEYLAAETNAEKTRYNNTTYAAYSFNENGVLKTPIRIDISNKVNQIPKHLIGVLKGGKQLVKRVDIEFYERISLTSDSKNQELKEVIQDYLVNGSWTKEDLEELGNLMALEDLEKIHTEFLVFEDDSIALGYLGIGNNQPYNISEKNPGYGKNRFYRYDLLRVGGSPYEQTSKVTAGRELKFSSKDIVYPEVTCDGTTFALHTKKGIAILDGNIWKKAMLKQPVRELRLETELKKNNGLDFLKRQLLAVFPSFDNYLQVFYDPLERTKSFSRRKTIIHLKKRGLLSPGRQTKFNVASDLYLHGHDPVLRIKPSLLLMYHMIETGKLNELIINTAKGFDTPPFTND